MYIEDLKTSAYLASGEDVRAIGWLDGAHPVRRGGVAPEILTRLNEHLEMAYQPHSFMGVHQCNLCPPGQGPKMMANLLVPTKKLLYVASGMIGHYIREHGYQPPSEFVQALMACPPQESAKYLELLEPFQYTWRPKDAPIVRRAGFWRRTGAYAIDAAVVTLPTVVVFYFFLGFNDALEAYNANRGDLDARIEFLKARNAVRDTSFFAWVLYCTFMEASRMQATLGKAALGLRAEELDGKRMTLLRSLARNSAKFLSLLPFGLGFIWAAFSTNKRTWHDIMSKTRVVYVKPEKDERA